MSVGLDIGSRTIKVVEIKGDKGSPALSGVGAVGVSFRGIDPLISDTEIVAISDVIKKLLSDAHISTRDVILAIPENKVFARTIKYPLLTDSEIASAVSWEADQYIPIPKTDAIVQHIILEKRQDITPPSVLVLLVAAPKNLVEKYIVVAESAGLIVSAIETELIALVRSLAPQKGVSIIMDFGAGSTDIAIAKDRQLMFSRSISTAGEAFTRAVSKALGMVSSQAEEYKKTYGLSKDALEGKVRGAIDPVFRTVVDEIKKAINFYTSEEKGETPSQLIVSGGTAGMPEAASSLTKILGMEVLIGNPFAKISADPQVLSNLGSFSPLYAIAVGLALRDLVD